MTVNEQQDKHSTVLDLSADREQRAAKVLARYALGHHCGIPVVLNCCFDRLQLYYRSPFKLTYFGEGIVIHHDIRSLS